MAELDLVLRSRRIVTAAGEVAGLVAVREGRIVAVEPVLPGRPAGLTARRIVDVPEDAALLPGLVDTHVHVNEPGRTQWEGFASATRAAAAGGVTTLLDMPLNSIPPTVHGAALAAKRQAAAGQCCVDVGFWGGAVPGNIGELRGLHEAGVFGFKCFLLPSGVDEFPPLSAAELLAYLRELRGPDALMIVHAEDPEVIERAPAPRGRRYGAFLASRPPAAEDVAVSRVIEAARSTGARVHILHLSSAAAVSLIRDARAGGVRVSAETCPHYLTFAAEQIPDGGTQYKCCPPIRTAANRELLWQALAAGDIDMIATDHSPCTADLKLAGRGDFGAAWGGIASLQLGLPAVWTQARSRGYALADVARWMARRPAEVAGLRHKGQIAVGYHADFAVFAPDQDFVVDPARLQHKNPLTPYAGLSLTGVVRATWLRGEQVSLEAPRGRLITRGAA